MTLGVHLYPSDKVLSLWGLVFSETGEIQTWTNMKIPPCMK